MGGGGWGGTEKYLFISQKKENLTKMYKSYTMCSNSCVHSHTKISQWSLFKVGSFSFLQSPYRVLLFLFPLYYNVFIPV